MPVATIPAAGIVTLIGVAIAVLAVAVYLFAIGLVLRRASAGLDKVIESVGQLPGQTYPVEAVLTAINRDLGAAREVLEGLLIKKLGALPEREGVLRYTGEAEEPAAPEPVAQGAPASIDYRRAAPEPGAAPEPQPAAPAAAAPAAPAANDAPPRIVHRRAGH